jgi:hypothetical protein
MLKWCSYCQSLIGEAQPYENGAIAHGMPQVCAHQPLILAFPSDLKDQSPTFAMSNWPKGGQGKRAVSGKGAN